MLYIKLPKGKVNAACERAGQRWGHLHVAAFTQYHADCEAWRKTPEGDPPSWNADRRYQDQASRLMDMADACTFSTGDVYVSVELWKEIRGYYDV